MNPKRCPLCDSISNNYYKDKFRSYYQCGNCSLVFVHADDFISPGKEKSRYDLHQNSPDDAGYRAFLSRMCTPLIARVPEGSSGLDFGCGPGPTLSVMLKELGYSMAVYDPFYFLDESVLDREYDFVTVTEVVEHFRVPLLSLNKSWSCVKSGGYLGIMTKLATGKEDFPAWHYITDDTHICFFSKETFVWLGREWNTAPEFIGKDIIFFHKP